MNSISGKHKLQFHVTLAVVGALLAATMDRQAQGDVIAGWDFNGIAQTWGVSPMPPTTSAANTSFVGWTRGSGVTTSGTAAANAWGGNGWDGAADLAGAVGLGNYATMSVSPASGYSLSLTGFDPYNIRRSGSGPATGQWQYSLDGTNFTSIGSPITWGTNTAAAGNLQSGGLDLSGISALQNVTSTVTFRIANWNTTTGSAGTWYHNNFQTGNDLILNGSLSQIVAATATTYSLSATATGASTVIVGGSTAISSKITNTGVAPNDTLNFSGLSANATGGTIGGPATNGNAVALGANVSNSGLSFTGTTPGAATVTPTVATATNGTIGGNATASAAATTAAVTVLDHADGAFNALGANTISHNFGAVAQGSSPAGFAFDIHNLITSAGFTSELDLAVADIRGTGDTSVFTTNVGAIADLAAGSFQSYLASFNTANPGTFSATYTFNVRDNTAYNGAVANTTPLILELSGSVTGTVFHAGDFDGDGDVDGADFVSWQTNFPKASGATRDQGDADGDGDVDGADFVVWQTNFPFSPGPGATPVPESGSLLIAALGVTCGTLALRRRRA